MVSCGCNAAEQFGVLRFCKRKPPFLVIVPNNYRISLHVGVSDKELVRVGEACTNLLQRGGDPAKKKLKAIALFRFEEHAGQLDELTVVCVLELHANGTWRKPHSWVVRRTQASRGKLTTSKNPRLSLEIQDVRKCSLATGFSLK